MKKYDNSIWRFGANFYPSNAINQLEMWQEETFSPELIDRELGFAEKINMNIMRVYLHDLVFEADGEKFFQRMEKYLEIASKHGIGTMFTIFDDCWKSEFSLGKQPDPVPFTHNSGWVQSPGNSVSDDLSQRPRLENYVKSLLDYFKHDERIILWDLYNEPGNGTSGENFAVDGHLRGIKSLPLLKDVFKWARDINPDQPVTAAPWQFNDEFTELNRFMFENSDVVTYHAYNKPNAFIERMEHIKYIADGRPIICSEYVARSAGNTFAECLPVLRKNNIGAINWGLVSGKTQTIYPWASLVGKVPEGIPFHDIFNQDGTLLIPEEQAVFDAVNVR